MRTVGTDETVELERQELIRIVEGALRRADDLEFSVAAIHLESALDVLRSPCFPSAEH